MKLFSIVLAAVTGYLFGCCNGAILISRRFFHEDIRKNGSGNAGLTNFYRVYGAKYLLPVILIDVGKTVAAVFLAKLLFAHAVLPVLYGKLWAGLWVCVGHALPLFFGFRGGKGILCAGTLLWMLDWRIALAAFAAFFLVTLLTGFVSLGSITACVSFPVTTALVFPGQPYALAFAILIAALAILAHHANIRRLLTGKENRFHFRGKSEKGKCM